MKIKSTRMPALLAAAGALWVTSLSLGASETDDRIESTAEQSYVFKTFLKDDDVKTKSEEGVVTLTGTVSEFYHKSLAEDTVEGLPGVKSVDNQLEIKGDTTPDGSDKWLRFRVMTVLAFHRGVNGHGTEVSADNGTVSLHGIASSKEQKDLTAEYAMDVEGVKMINNEMTVADSPTEPRRSLGEKIDDASVTALVKSSLFSHRSTNGLKTKIVTREGVVTISGIAKSVAQKGAVTKLASDIHGVDSVTNEMTLKDD